MLSYPCLRCLVACGGARVLFVPTASWNYRLAARLFPVSAIAAGVARRLQADKLAGLFQKAANDGRGKSRPHRVVIPARGSHAPADGTESILMDPVRGTDRIVLVMLAYGWDGFEQPMPDVFVALCRRADGTVIDVGANTGWYSLLACAVHPSLRVLAFEPYPPVAKMLKRNVTVNRRADRIEIRGQAVGRETGSATLFVPSNEHGLVETSSSLNPEFKGAASGVAVDVTTLDEVVRLGKVTNVAIVKVDVEGFELDVLRGAVQLLRTQRPLMFIEVLPGDTTVHIDQLRAEVGYTDIRLQPTAAVIGAELTFDEDGWNHLLVPDERVAEIALVLSDIGLTVVVPDYGQDCEE